MNVGIYSCPDLECQSYGQEFNKDVTFCPDCGTKLQVIIYNVGDPDCPDMEDIDPLGLIELDSKNERIN